MFTNSVNLLGLNNLVSQISSINLNVNVCSLNRYSHGHAVSLEDLKEFVEPDHR